MHHIMYIPVTPWAGSEELCLSSHSKKSSFIGSFRGHHHSEQNRKAISQRMKVIKGENPPWLGKHHSPETRAKISLTMKTVKHARPPKQS